MSAPPFSSFPTSFSSFPELDPPSGSSKDKTKKTKEGREKERRRSKHESQDRRERSPDSKHHKSKSKSSKPKRKHDRSPSHSSKKDAGVVEPDEVSDRTQSFYSDRRGDPLNIQYDGLHAGDVPRYHLVARGKHILGLPSIWVASRRSGKGIEVGLSNRRKLSELTDPGTRSLLAHPPTRRINQANSSKYEEVDGFIPVTSNASQRDKHPSGNVDRFLQLDTRSDSESSEDEAEEPVPSSEEEDENIQLTAEQEHLKLLDQELAEDPSSIEHWLQLLARNLATIPLTSKNATKARADVTLAVIERALSAYPQNATSITLLVKRLQAGEEVWSETRLRDEWEKAFKVGGIDIWMEWLEWRIRRGKEGVDGFVQDAVRVLNSLDLSDIGELRKVRVLWRTAVAFQNAGYYERATALYQAQAELALKLPSSLVNAPLQAQLSSLEEFWDSGALRIGDPGATGWGEWVNSGSKDYTGQHLAISPLPPVDERLDPYTAWAEAEKLADATCRTPCRPDSDDDSGDPYATTLFSDISSLLVQLRTSSAKDAFRFSWLALLGLHIPGRVAVVQGGGWDDRWSLTHLSSSSYLDLLFPKGVIQRHLTTDAVAGALVGRVKNYASSFGPVKNWAHDALQPLDTSLRDEGLGKAHNKNDGLLWGKEDAERVDVGFVKEVLRQLRLDADDVDWVVLSLAFEASAVGVKGALKLSRTLLSETRDSIPLWAAHAQLERIRGRPIDARKVYSTVLVSAPIQSGSRSPQLWWDWAEMEWLSGNDDEALSVVLRSAEIEGRGGTSILRAKRFLKDSANALVEPRRWKDREAWVKLAALLEILTGAGHIGALAIFEEQLGKDVACVARESMTMASLLLIHQYVTVRSHPMPTSVLRDRVGKGLEEYPSNSVILGLFLEGEKGQGVWGRVREELGESRGRTKDMTRRVEEVWVAGWEQSRWAEEVERTRSGLAAAVTHERTRGSAILWRIYIEFEIRAGQLERAKQLVFQAIRECPLCKDLYLVAFSTLRTVFSRHELNGLAETMAERGIRMRRELDEVDGMAVDGNEQSEGEDNGLQDEIEQNAEELRRLRPY
ncbi:hypothetical protein BDN72DRAFT_830394 [Pluteus cervinus]|uniref:Uncharacterized protein n=1 Tax=Pluteus cervinus TaxID=181527 RepID=A0ACD3BH60_9AGAR|nr:hypothetical protein BDN72DRAFT_830394 [Pluteus cervinus]